MADSAHAEPEPVLAELRWNLRSMRIARVQMVLFCVLWGALAMGAALLSTGWWRLLSVFIAAGFVLRLYAARVLLAADMPQRLQVFDSGLWLETERGEGFIGWDQVDGFTGVAKHTPSPVAPRTTTGGLSSSPSLRAGGKSIPLERPAFGEVKAVVELIEKRLAARQAAG